MKTLGRMVKREMDGRFLNVDLDVRSLAPLGALIAAFGARVFVLHAGKNGRWHEAHLELSSQRHSKDANVAIIHFVRLVKTLPRREREIRNRARFRQFNIGVTGGQETYELNLGSKVIDAVVSVDGEIVVTIYPHEPQPNSVLERTSARRAGRLSRTSIERAEAAQL